MKRLYGLLAGFLLLLSSSCVAAIRLESASAPAVGRAEPTRPRTPLFPQLTRLRDGVVELIFGQPRHRKARVPAPHSPSRRNHANEVVLRFNLTSADEQRALADATRQLFVDVWSWSLPDGGADLRLHRDDISSLLSLLPTPMRSSYSTLIADLPRAILDTHPAVSSHDRPTQDTYQVDKTNDNLFFQDYQPLAVIAQWMRLLEAMFPSIVEMISIGKSYEGRDILALRVGAPAPPVASATGPRKTIVVMGGMHAREWISTSSTNFAAWSFVTLFGKDPLITRLLHAHTYVFIPALNPDGVEYTWQVDRLWRKSRQPTSLRFCAGYDMDHAFGFQWDASSGVDHSPCSESYGGDEPFQAVEALRLAEWARNETANNNVRFVGVLDLHSYSQQVLYPYVFSCRVEPPNLENLQELAAGLAKSLRLSNGELYTVSPACEAMPTASADEDQTRSRMWPMARSIEVGGGSAIDWFFEEMRARYSYHIKLRDTGSYGFLLPRESIIPTGNEVVGALKYLGDYLLGNNGIEKLSRARRPMQETPDMRSMEDDTNSDNEVTTRHELRRDIEMNF